MSIATELAKRNQRLEYILCIEGVGWPTKWSDLTSGFDGDVFVSNDFNGDLASVLGCTIHHGLRPEGQINDSFDPIKCEFSPGGLSATIEDIDGWWLANYTPRKTATLADTLNGDHSWPTTTITLTTASSAAGDLVWIALRELVKLGTKVGNTYTGSTRGYLGTRRGSIRREPNTHRFGLWRSGTSVSDVARWWRGRRMALFWHVPGETVGNVELIWYGKLKEIDSPIAGETIRLGGVGDFLSGANRIVKPHFLTVISDREEYTGNSTGTANQSIRRLMELGPGPQPELASEENWSTYTLALAYRYRSEPGGLAGAISAWSPYVTTPQALDTSNDTDVIMTFFDFEGDILLVLKRANGLQARFVYAEFISSLGTSSVSQRTEGQRVVTEVQGHSGRLARPLLAKWFGNNHDYNRFCINGHNVSHPIDVALCFMLSCDQEIFRADATAGSTGTVVNFTSTGAAADDYIGLALHCVEGTNRWKAREITDNSTTSITVGVTFGAGGAGSEHQVRNSIYDVLPFGWGMGIDARMVDLDSFMAVKDQLPDASIGPFIIGLDDEIDLWEMLQTNIFQPWGILVYFNRSTRKISAAYLGQPLGDGVVESFTPITTNDIVNPGSLDEDARNPVGAIELKIRSMAERVVNLTRRNEYLTSRVQQLDKLVPVTIRSSELEDAFSPDDLDTLKFESIFHTPNTAARLIGRLSGLVGLYSTPPHVWRGVELFHSLFPDLQLASWVTTTWASAPANRLAGSRGWDTVLGRVISIGINLLERPTLECEIELFAALSVGKTAPAATVSSTGTDVTAYVNVADTDFVADVDDDKDWYHFAVGDLIEVRDATGAVVNDTAPLTIKDFGANHSSTPEGASTSRIYFEETTTYSGTAAYMTFASWAAGNTARMEQYAAYADASGALTGGDSAKKYT